MSEIYRLYTGTKEGIQIEVECYISADIKVEETIGGSFENWDYEIIREFKVLNIKTNIISVWKKEAGKWIDFSDYDEQKIKSFLAKQMAADEEELINELIEKHG